MQSSGNSQTTGQLTKTSIIVNIRKIKVNEMKGFHPDPLPRGERVFYEISGQTTEIMICKVVEIVKQQGN